MPPLADTVTVVVPPLHNMVPADEDADRVVGSVTVPVVVDEQPLASVTV